MSLIQFKLNKSKNLSPSAQEPWFAKELLYILELSILFLKIFAGIEVSNLLADKNPLENGQTYQFVN